MPTKYSNNYTGTGAKTAIPVNSDEIVSVATTVTGTITYNIEVQLTDNGAWTAAAGFTGLTASLPAQALPMPVSAVRTNITAGAGSVVVEVLSAYRG